MLEQADVVALPGPGEQGALDGPAGGVGGVQDPPGGMAALAGQVASQ